MTAENICISTVTKSRHDNHKKNAQLKLKSVLFLN